ncbi:MAG: Mut7-C RNAse domain-containing protein [bacterium]|nr:Mut7-C RNAse domain-containing protein [bacterium]
MTASPNLRRKEHAFFHIHGELNDFLPYARRNLRFCHPFEFRASIKDMVESLGVPHAEIELLVVGGVSVDFSYLVRHEDEIQVYPDFEAVDLPQKRRLRPELDGRPRFVLDTHLGRLASYLRMMGFDTLYRNDYPDDELAQISNAENRVLLTRDIGLLKRSLVTHGRFVRETNPRLQLIELMQYYDLPASVVPFRRCLKCNGLLRPISKEAILDRLSSDTASHYDEFHQCTSCDQIYWKGPHYEQMRAFMAEVMAGD